jgi:trehalose-phosphatase
VTTASDTLRSALDRLVSAHRSGRTLALLFDYDGTLVPIVEHPSLAVLAPEIRMVLQQLVRVPRVVVGILSGRSLDDLETTVGIPELFYAGTSGLELSLRGSKIVPAEAPQVRDMVARVADRLDAVSATYSGSWLERKPLGLTFHYRHVATHRIGDLFAGLHSTLASYASALRVVEGPMAIEITPELGWTKGTAVQVVCRETARDALPLYVGDHANDAEALASAAALGGVSVGIGPNAPDSAEYRVLDHNTFAQFLLAILQSLSDASQLGLSRLRR